MGKLPLGFIVIVALTACMPAMLEEEPAGGSVPFGNVVLVDDATCPAGQVKKITGGNNNAGIPRKSECITRP